MPPRANEERIAARNEPGVASRTSARFAQKPTDPRPGVARLPGIDLDERQQDLPGCSVNDIDEDLRHYLLPGLPVERIRACYAGAAGNEIESGKFASNESSAALAANTFGFFLIQPETLPPLPGTEDLGWPASTVELERVVRFPWSGGRHPCLDVLIGTQTALIGVESKRYEPFRPKSTAELSDAYDRDVWGKEMRGYQRIRDELRSGALAFRHLDAAQLIKHAFGLRTTVHKDPKHSDKQAVLFYLFAEPKAWSDRRAIPSIDVELHRSEIQRFSELVHGDEVRFLWSSYAAMLDVWRRRGLDAVGDHVEALHTRFDL